jgi:glutamine synthetase
MEKDLITRLSAISDDVYDVLNQLRDELARAEEERKTSGTISAAIRYSERVIPVMAVLRMRVDTLETLTAKDAWPLPTYGEMTYRQ